MSKLKFSRQFLKCIYMEKLKYEVNNIEEVTLSEFIEEVLIDHFNINLIDLNSEKVNIDFDVYGGNMITEDSLIEDLEFDKYVYVYMNPYEKLDSPIKISISGEIFEFDYNPFYIGKGSGERMFDHLKLDGVNPLKDNIIKSIIDRGSDPIIRIIKNGLIDVEAYTLENILISNLDLSNISGGKVYKNDYIMVDKLNTIEYNKASHLIELLNSSNTSKEVAIKMGVSERTIYRMKKQLNIKKVDNNWIQIKSI